MASVFTAADLVGVKPIRAVSGLPGFKISEQPVLATGKVRQVGELVAMCVAPTRAEAEDIAASVTLDLEELPAVYDMLKAREPGSALVHEHWGDNVFLETNYEVDISAALDAPIKVTREISTARQCMSPLEGRGVVATFDRRLDQLTLHSAAQMPHITRSGLAECLGMEEGQIRVISPDVGGGFGHKGILLPEEVCLSWLTMRRGHPVRWTEDRREHLVASSNCREHHYKITVYADRDGTLRGIDCEATVDSGAYSSYPFSACLEAAQVASILPGPYKMPAYRCRTFSVATNKCPILPYRGVARTGVCFALELMLDLVAAGSRARAGRGAAAQSGAARADAVRQHHQEAFRQRRLSGSDAARAGRDRHRRHARAQSRARPTAGGSASASPSIASRRRTAPRSIPAGAFRWCRATSRRRRA